MAGASLFKHCRTPHCTDMADRGCCTVYPGCIRGVCRVYTGMCTCKKRCLSGVNGQNRPFYRTPLLLPLRFTLPLTPFSSPFYAVSAPFRTVYVFPAPFLHRFHCFYAFTVFYRVFLSYLCLRYLCFMLFIFSAALRYQSLVSSL